MLGLNSSFMSPFSSYSQYKNQTNYYNNLHNYNLMGQNQYKLNNNYVEHGKPCSTPKQDNNSTTEDEKHETREFFEILGIKLYFDDILLLCLIFFLYNEDVHDEMLFMALILLLLS